MAPTKINRNIILKVEKRTYFIQKNYLIFLLFICSESVKYLVFLIIKGLFDTTISQSNQKDNLKFRSEDLAP
jgi:hypothetical protein